MKITMRDVAKKAGVSLTTVSRAINNSPSISRELREAVMHAIRALNYIRIRNPTSGKKHKSKKIGVIVSDVLSYGVGPFIRGIEEIARRHAASIILFDSQNDLQIEEDNICQIIDKTVDGLILISLSSENERIIDIIDDHFPFILLDRYLFGKDGLNVVYSDNNFGACLATSYLLDLGHREIVYIDGDGLSSIRRDRIDGFRRAFNERNLSVNEKLIIKGNYSSSIAYKRIYELIQDGFSFTAVFASSDEMAFGAKRALEEQGYRIPDDISLLGYDGIELSSTISLTTVYHGAFEMAKEATSALIDIIDRRLKSPIRVVIQPSLIIRNSCKKV